jgi:hypothetical protein
VGGDFLGELGHEFLFPVFEFVEFHFDEFLVGEGIVQRLEEGGAHAVFAKLNYRFEELGTGFEGADFAVI